MRIYAYLPLLLCLLLFTTCKPDDEENTDPDGVDLLVSTDLLDQSREKLYELGAQNNSTPQEAVMLTAEWLRTQPGVANIYVWDSTSIKIVTTDGVETYLSVVLTDANGYSIYRGGGGGNKLAAFSAISGSTCSDLIDNDKVLLFAPAESQFYASGELQAVANRIGSTDKRLQVSIVKNADCTPEKSNEFKNYGLVIIDTHGLPDGYMSGLNLTYTKNTKPKSNSQLQQNIANRLGTSRLAMLKDGRLACTQLVTIQNGNITWHAAGLDTAYTYDLYITSKYIKTMPQMPNTILFGNMCYSGYGKPNANSGVTNPIRTAFTDLNPITYYCFTQSNDYSRVVTDWFAKRMESQIVNRLVENTDSTGIAHLKPDNITEYEDTVFQGWSRLFFKQYKSRSHCYGCGGQITDSRDGQKYNTVCIGDQVWMAQNLNYNAPGSLCYDNSAANCTSYGRLYDWNTVMNGDSASSATPSGRRGICPQGWHIPSANEWTALIYNLGGTQIAGGHLRDTIGWDAPNTGATNSVGFNGKPAGYYNGTDFMGRGSQTAWWTASDYTTTPNYSYYITTGSQYASVATYSQPRTAYSSCRCIKDW
ncbi:MAG: FISUMP domain-containing protein [Chitinophagales bacterium]|nr:FISUMP domain-containing protein [Chitinophagales bacterium]